MDYGNKNSPVLFIKYEPSKEELKHGILFPPSDEHWKKNERDVMVGEFRHAKISPSSVHFTTLWDEAPEKPKRDKRPKNEWDAVLEIYEYEMRKGKNLFYDITSDKQLIVLVGQKMIDYIFGKGTYSTPWGLELDEMLHIWGFPLFSSGFGTIGEIRLSLEKIKKYIDNKEIL